MIDFHTHILPGIDDGSRDVRTSLEMISEEINQRVEGIVLTPHFYANEDDIPSFLKRRDEAWQELTKEMSEQGIEIPLRKGGEIYYFQGIGDANQLPELAIEGTDLILLEMPFEQWTEEVYEDVKKIIEKRKMKVILAHVERFYQFQKSKKVWDKVFELPVYAQVNAGNIDKMKKRHFLKKFLKKDVPVVLGSDCHNMSSRVPNLKQGFEAIGRIFGESMLTDIRETEERLFEYHA